MYKCFQATMFDDIKKRMALRLTKPKRVKCNGHQHEGQTWYHQVSCNK